MKRFRASDRFKRLSLLSSLLHGLPPRVLQMLIDWDFWSKSTVVVDSTAITAEPSLVPWPVALTLSAFSRKHIFLDKTKPKLSNVLDSFTHMSRKIKWAYHFAVNPELHDHTSYCKRPIYTTPVYPKMLPPEIEAFTTLCC